MSNSFKFCPTRFSRGGENVPRGVSLPCDPSNGPGFFTHSTNRGWANLFNGRVICRKPKTPASRKTSSQFQYKYCKECKLYIANIKFLLDFLVPENLDSTLLDVRNNSPKYSFFRVQQWFDFTNFITEKQNS